MYIWVSLCVQQKLSCELKVCVIQVQSMSFIHCYMLVLCKKEIFSYKYDFLNIAQQQVEEPFLLCPSFVEEAVLAK